MPAYEYTGMDGYVIPANSTTNFKLPPLSSRNYATPESVVIFIDYKTRSSNNFINKIRDLYSIYWARRGKQEA